MDHRRRIALVLLIAALLRLPRSLCRWDEVTWSYSAYPADTIDALRLGDLTSALTSFSGLHPPLFPLLHTLQEAVHGPPLLWLLTSVLASWGAVLLVARRDWLAGLLLATSPVQVHYAAEVNDYPLLAFFVAAAWTSRERGDWKRLALTGVLSTWTHVLAGFAASLAALTLPRRDAVRVLAVMAVAALPLVPGVVVLLHEPGTFRQPPFQPDLVVSDYIGRFGLLPLLLLPSLVRGARHRPALALGWTGTMLFIVSTVALRVAAPHQFPYLLALGVPAVLLTVAGSGPRLRVLALAVAVLQGAWLATFEAARLQHLAADGAFHPAGRAVDVALSEVTRGWTCQGPPTPQCTGDALYLLAPTGTNDDDKGHTSAVLWRLRPWWPMPPVRPYDLHPPLYRHGQPRLVPVPGIAGDGLVVYVADQVRATLEEAIGAHRRTWLVVHGQGHNRSFTTELQDRLGALPEMVGGDALYRVVGAPSGDPVSPRSPWSAAP